jgi:hypothetical protein
MRDAAALGSSSFGVILGVCFGVVLPAVAVVAACHVIRRGKEHFREYTMTSDRPESAGQEDEPPTELNVEEIPTEVQTFSEVLTFANDAQTHFRDDDLGEAPMMRFF